MKTCPKAATPPVKAIAKTGMIYRSCETIANTAASGLVSIAIGVLLLFTPVGTITISMPRLAPVGMGCGLAIGVPINSPLGLQLMYGTCVLWVLGKIALETGLFCLKGFINVGLMLTGGIDKNQKLPEGGHVQIAEDRLPVLPSTPLPHAVISEESWLCRI